MTYIQKEDEARIVKNSHLPTIKRIPNKLWGEMEKILPKEKPLKTVGRRPIVKYRLVLDGVLYVLRTGCQWKMLPKEYSSSSICHRRFQEWNKRGVFKKHGLNLKIYDKEMGINWTWPLSIDSISVKSPLGGGENRK